MPFQRKFTAEIAETAEKNGEKKRVKEREIRNIVLFFHFSFFSLVLLRGLRDLCGEPSLIGYGPVRKYSGEPGRTFIVCEEGIDYPLRSGERGYL
jgi:hypothetical protein